MCRRVGVHRRYRVRLELEVYAGYLYGTAAMAHGDDKSPVLLLHLPEYHDTDWQPWPRTETPPPQSLWDGDL